MTNKSIKIFISYHKKSTLFKNEILEPIHVGRELSENNPDYEWLKNNMIGDDTGDNISKSNPRFNELSGQYWVWKHYDEIGNPDYIGLMHYRRHFIFDENFDIRNKKLWLSGTPVYRVKSYNKECEQNISSENIYKTISSDFECFVMKENDINLFMDNDLYMKEHYIFTIPGAKRHIWNKFYNIVKNMYPEHQDILDKFTYGHKMYCCNMFIMTKDLFFRYNEFCFNILKELENQIDYRYFNSTEMRFCGYIGEYVLTLFIMILQKENRKIKYLDAIFIENVDNKLSNFYKNIFSVKNENMFKVVTILGCKIKFKNKHRQLMQQLDYQNFKLQELSAKVSELQEELILLKKQ